jgi:hypothetical protein
MRLGTPWDYYVQNLLNVFGASRRQQIGLSICAEKGESLTRSEGTGNSEEDPSLPLEYVLQVDGCRRPTDKFVQLDVW